MKPAMKPAMEPGMDPAMEPALEPNANAQRSVKISQSISLTNRKNISVLRELSANYPRIIRGETGDGPPRSRSELPEGGKGPGDGEKKVHQGQSLPLPPFLLFFSIFHFRDFRDFRGFSGNSRK